VSAVCEVTDVRLLRVDTIIPPAGAGPLIVTVASAVSPAVTAVGATTSDCTAGGKTVSVAVRDTPRAVAESVTVCDVAVGVVAIETVAELLPLPIVIAVEPTCATLGAMVSVTSVPLLPAGPDRRIVAVVDVPPVTEATAKVTETSDGCPPCARLSFVPRSSPADHRTTLRAYRLKTFTV
jgi:hypothetical protein